MTETRRPNIVIINPDEWRADCVGCYGHPVIRTPHTDQLAAEGTRFDTTVCQHTVCSPSRCSFMSGWYPHVRGKRTLWHLLRREDPNLFRDLKKSGYRVGWFGKNDLLAQDCFDESVDEWSAGGGGTHLFSEPPVAEPGEPGYFNFLHRPLQGTLDDNDDGIRVRLGCEFIERQQQRDEPFCLFLPLVMPHCPYTAPQPYYDMYDPDEMPELNPPDLPGKPSFHRLIRETRGLDRCDPATLRKAYAVYAGMITAVDDLIGRVVATLKATGQYDHTVIIIHSDHGDWPGDYGLVEKWSSALDEALVRVPMIIRMPGGAPGHVVEEPVELMDQFATICELAGVTPQHTHFSHSLVPQLHGAAGDPQRAVFAEGGYGLHEPHCLEGDPVRDAWSLDQDPPSPYRPKLMLNQTNPEAVCRSVMIRTATHKLVRRPESGEHELYHLAEDQWEHHNRIDDPTCADVRRDLETRLLDWYITTSDVCPIGDDDARGMAPDRLPG